MKSYHVRHAMLELRVQVPVNVSHVHLRPGQARAAPALLHLCLSLPPASAATISLGFRRAFLAVWEQAADAHRGVDVPAAVMMPRSLVLLPLCAKP